MKFFLIRLIMFDQNITFYYHYYMLLSYYHKIQMQMLQIVHHSMELFALLNSKVVEEYFDLNQNKLIMLNYLKLYFHRFQLVYQYNNIQVMIVLMIDISDE